MARQPKTSTIIIGIERSSVIITERSHYYIADNPRVHHSLLLLSMSLNLIYMYWEVRKQCSLQHKEKYSMTFCNKEQTTVHSWNYI